MMRKRSLIVVKALLDAGADPNQTKSDGESALCCRKQCEIVVKALLDAGTDMNQSKESQFASTTTCHCKNGHLPVIKVLLLAGDDVNKINAESEERKRELSSELSRGVSRAHWSAAERKSCRGGVQFDQRDGQMSSLGRGRGAGQWIRGRATQERHSGGREKRLPAPGFVPRP